VAFATVEQFHDRSPDFDLESEADVAVVERLLADASAEVAAETGQSFAAPAGAPELRYFWGTGTPYLRVDAHVGAIVAESVSLDGGREAPGFVDLGTLLVASSGSGLTPGARWPEGVRVAVTAAWGAAAYPGDIVEATLAIAQTNWLRSRADGLEDKLPEGYPDSVLKTFARYRNARAWEAIL
jgi:hypothetical protein